MMCLKTVTLVGKLNPCMGEGAKAQVPHGPPEKNPVCGYIALITSYSPADACIDTFKT